MSNAAGLYDNGRDDFLATATSRPPSKFDSIEYLKQDVHKNSTIAFRTSSLRKPKTVGTTASGEPVSSTTSSRDVSSGGGSGCGHTHNSSNSSEETCAASSWKAELSGRSFTAPCRSGAGVESSYKTPAGVPKKFFWGPKVTRQRQEVERDVRRTNKGEPATFAMAVDECPSTVSTIRSMVPRRLCETPNDGDSTVGDLSTSSIYSLGMEPFVRTSITDRAHDGIYDTDTAHKTTLAGRIMSGDVRSPHISKSGKRFDDLVGGGAGKEMATENLEPGQYDLDSGLDATSVSSTFLPLPREKCTYDSYIRRGVGQTSGSRLGPGTYRWKKNPAKAHGPAAICNRERWTERPTVTAKASTVRGPWDDVGDAWGRGGYIERAIPRDCNSYLPMETLSYVTRLDVDHLDKETFATAVQQSPRRYAASFSSTQEPNWRVTGEPHRGPGTYAVERAERLLFPAPNGGAGDADPERPSLPFRARHTPFNTGRLADGYKTLRPRFATPRSALYASELAGPIRVARTSPAAADAGAVTSAERTAGALIGGGRSRLPFAKAQAAAVKAVAAEDLWGVGGRDSRFVRLERPSVLDPERDGSGRCAAAAIWRKTNNKSRTKQGYG